MTRTRNSVRGSSAPGSLNSVIVNGNERKSSFQNLKSDFFLLILKRLSSTAPFGSIVRRAREERADTTRKKLEIPEFERNTHIEEETQTKLEIIDSGVEVPVGAPVRSRFAPKEELVSPQQVSPFSLESTQSTHLLSPLSEFQKLHIASLSPAVYSPLSSVDLVSPNPKLSFSPGLQPQAKKTQLVMQELVESEQSFIAGMKAVTRYFADACEMRCHNLAMCCEPLVSFSAHLQEMVANHEELVRKLAKTQFPYNLLEISESLEKTNYAEYSGTVLLLVFLIHEKVSPFEPQWISSLNQFLEAFQPFGRRMDLSVKLLMQKPLARIAKYPLFLLAILQSTRGDMAVARALELVTEKLTDIDRQIETESVKFDTLKVLEANLNYTKFVRRPAHFYGPITFCSDYVMFSVGVPGLTVHQEAVSVICHRYHMVVASKRKPATIRHILPIPACTFIHQVYNCVSGLTSSADFAAKVLFGRSGNQYEILLASVNEEDHAEFVSCLGQGNSIKFDGNSKLFASADVHIDPKLAICDIVEPQNVSEETRQSCYFSQVFDVNVAEALQQYKSE